MASLTHMTCANKQLTEMLKTTVQNKMPNMLSTWIKSSNGKYNTPGNFTF